MHVFIKEGLQFWLNQNASDVLTIFEVGFGTGLNAILTLIETEKLPIKVNYFAVEKYPLTFNLVQELNYQNYVDAAYWEVFTDMHQQKFNQEIKLTNNFNLTILTTDFANLNLTGLPKFDLVFFDAFAPDKQPELWSLQIFKNLFLALNNQGVLTTYSSKGEVKRNLKESGFLVERIPGPPYKRHMLRAIKKPTV